MKIFHNISRLYTMSDDALGVIEDAAFSVEDGRFNYVGPRAHCAVEGATMVDLQGAAVMPALVDCHTHLLFAGSRRDEFALRSRGASYAEILEAGGGILNTCKAVRAASVDELVELALPRVNKMLARGVTTIEVKSGYGLSLDDELKSLRAIKALDARTPVNIVPTFLGAHAVPEDVSKEAYVELVVSEMLPAVVEEDLARFCDIFIDRGAFTLDDGRRVLTKAKDLGLGIRVHAEQLSRTGAASLAAELGAVSASHLENISSEDIAKLADEHVVAEVLSLAQVFLGMETRIPGRALADEGVVCAVASDMNPGSAHSCDLHLAAGLAVSMCGLTADEALLGITVNGAAALEVDAGRIHQFAKADFVVLDTDSAYDLVYDWGENHVARVFIDGVDQTRTRESA